METMERLKKFWNKKRVLITGHTGFKGSWLSMTLKLFGADLYGYALKPPTNPSLFEDCKLKKIFTKSLISDIRDFKRLKEYIKTVKPDIVIHMAAQPLVRDSYTIPKDTYEINVIGTVNLLESIRLYPTVKVILNVTTDKVYENKETKTGYKETDPLGGYDPYSSSKACSELVTSAYNRSFFTEKGIITATARAGNVIGGGDWAKDRLIPDVLRSILKNEKVLIRNPYSIRPWQHVLESLSGYITLIEKMYNEGIDYSGAWNFGPDEKDLHTVEWIVKKLLNKIKPNKGYEISKGKHPHEAKLLVLNPTKSKQKLGWEQKWDLDYSLEKIAEWFYEYRKNRNTTKICHKQIEEYFK